MTTGSDPRYRRHRFPPEVISMAVWLYFRFPLSLRMVEEMLAARGIDVSHETVRRWAGKFGRDYAQRLRRRAICPGDTWHLDEVVITIAGQKHWLWRAVDGHRFVLDVLVQKRARHQSRKAPDAQTVEEICEGPARDDHRQTTLLRRGETGTTVWRRASTTQGSQQQGRKFASTDPTTGAHHEMLQISAACSEVSLHPRSDRQPVSSSPGSTVRK